MTDDRSVNDHSNEEFRADELLDLFVRIWGDDLAPEEFARLEQTLRNDPAARRRYYEFIELHGDLSWTFGRLVTANQPDDRPAANQPAVKKPAGTTVLGFLGGVVDYLNDPRRLMFMLVAVVLCGWLAFQFGPALWGRWIGGNAQMADQGGAGPGANGSKGPEQKPDNHLAAPSSEPHDKAIAWLSGSVSGRWQVVAAQPVEPANWEIGTEFAAGQQVSLIAGRGEITFRSGAKIVVTAPAQFSVTSALETDLQFGKLSARVPHDYSPQALSQQGPLHSEPVASGATGFTVNTPAGSVVDLGTEFGVSVGTDRKMDVQVFVGAVKVNASAAGSAVPAAGVTVLAGQSLHVEPGKPEKIAESTDKDRIPRDLTTPSVIGDQQLAAYLDLMHRLKPVVWLRMEGKDGDRTIHDDAAHGQTGKANSGTKADFKLFWEGEGNPFVDGPIGKSLWLRGPKFKDYAIIPDYPKAKHDKLSVVAWVYADSRPNFATIAKNWCYANGRGQFHFGLVSAINPQDTTFQPDSVDLGVEITQRNGRTITLREGEEHPFPIKQWQHVAFVADGTTLRLYREGREVASTEHTGLRSSVAIKSLGIGVKTGDSGKAPDEAFPDYWNGRLDEIAIFNAALTAEEIRSLAAAAPQ